MRVKRCPEPEDVLVVVVDAGAVVLVDVLVVVLLLVVVGNAGRGDEQHASNFELDDPWPFSYQAVLQLLIDDPFHHI